MSKAETRSTVLLKHHLKTLKLPTMHRECEALAARCAKENVDHLGFLLQLCERELLESVCGPRPRFSAQQYCDSTHSP